MQQNVVKLKNNYIYGDIITFLNSKSKNTRTSYKKAIGDFFFYTRSGKSLEDLTMDDLNVRHFEIVEYQNHLKDNFKSKSVNQKINAIRSLFKTLKREERYDFIRMEAFDVERLSEEDSDEYGFFDNLDEAIQYIEATKKLPNGEMKSILIDLAIHTHLRKSDLLAAKPCDFKQNRTHKDIWIYRTINRKGKRKIERPITKRLWDRIENYILTNKIGEREPIFNISARHVDFEINRINKILGIDPERNIVFHSLRKVAAIYEIDENNDIYAAQKAMDHKKIDTTLKYYYKRKVDHSKATGITMEQKTDISLLNELSKDELLELIQGCCNKQTKKIMNDKAKDIVSDKIKSKVVVDKNDGVNEAS